MPPTVAANQAGHSDGPTTAGDDLDNLFEYDVDMNDPFSDNYKPPAATTSKAKANDTTKKSSPGAGLGIDEEIEISRKPRAPRVKLDENRLLSANGIPKLRKKAKEHLKFKGRGHEYSDASNLLAFYQLWLDDLFPKARFLDALNMVEKMGHKKLIQIKRMEWINEGKPRSSVHEDSIFYEPALAPRQDERERTASRIAPIFEKAVTERPRTPVRENRKETEDLYNATPQHFQQKPTATQPSIPTIFGDSGESIFRPAKTIAADAPPEDDLDALLAEEETMQASKGKVQNLSMAQKENTPQGEFDDEMEAMAEMDDMW